MKRSETLRAYQDYSDRASSNVRQLGFAALAVIWIFRPAGTAIVQFPAPLIWSGSLATGALAADFLQYIYGAAAWGWFHRRKERAGATLDEEVRAPRGINWPTMAFFWTKALLIIASYSCLLSFLLKAQHST